MRQFLSHLSLLMVLNLLVKPAYLLVIDARIQDVLGPDIFGSYFPLLSLGILLNILLDVGLSNHMTRLISANNEAVTGAYRAGSRAKLALFPLYFMSLMLVGWGLGYRGESMQWLAWIGINQALLSAILYVRAGLQGLGAHKTDAWVSISDRSMLLLGLGIVLAIQPGFEIAWLLLGTTAALSIALALACWRLMIHMKDAQTANHEESATSIWEQLAQGWPYALLFLLMMTYHRVDAIMLERMHPDGARQAGWYAMGYRLFEASNMIGFLFATLLLPYFSRMLALKEDIRPLAIGASRLLMVGGGAIAWTAWFWPGTLLSIFYSHEIAAAASVLPWLMLSFAIFAQGYVFSTLLTARGDMKQLNLLAAVGAIGNIGLNLWWIPKYGALGCAMASAITQGLVVGLQCFVSLKKFPSRTWWLLGKSFALHTLAAGAICWSLSRFAPDDVWVVLVSLIACLGAGFLPGIMDYSTLRQLLSSKMNTFADS